MEKGCVILLYFARHGETTLNKQHIFRGSSDHPLDPGGRQQAHDLKDIFTPITLSFIATSDKKRAATTAEIINQSKNMDLIITNQLRPWDVGDFGGQKKTKENVEALQEYVNNPHRTPPGGTALQTFRNRVRPVLQEAAQKAYETKIPGLIVSHSSVLHEIGELFGGHHEAAHVKPGGISVLYVDNGKMEVEPIYLPDDNASTQNILGVKSGRMRSGLTS